MNARGELINSLLENQIILETINRELEKTTTTINRKEELRENLNRAFVRLKNLALSDKHFSGLIRNFLNNSSLFFKLETMIYD